MSKVELELQGINDTMEDVHIHAIDGRWIGEGKRAKEHEQEGLHPMRCSQSATNPMYTSSTEPILHH